MEGEATKNKTYSSHHTFSSEEVAAQEFKRTVEKLFDVNRWTKLPGISSTFQLYNSLGEMRNTRKLQVKDFIKILLPGPVPENWVVVTEIKEKVNMAEFTVSPSMDPTTKGKEREEIKHFFIDEATSTFRVEIMGKTIYAFEIGKNEGVNNRKGEAGKRKLINTLVAEGGWAGFQKFQWNKLTDYLVHRIELEEAL